MKNILLLVAIVALCLQSVSAQDYEREARWRAEVVPNLVVGAAVDIPGSDGRRFLGIHTAAATARTALVIVHGIGVHPDHGIICRLRMDLADRGFTTLSIQMPVLGATIGADAYRALMPAAADRIARAAAWLQAKGHSDLVLVSHSMGSRMANMYFDSVSQPQYRAWVTLGLSDPFTAKFAAAPPIPVLDVLGELDLEAVLRHSAARKKTAESTVGGRQITIAGANHFYADREAQLIDIVTQFIGR